MLSITPHESSDVWGCDDKRQLCVSERRDFDTNTDTERVPSGRYGNATQQHPHTAPTACAGLLRTSLSEATEIALLKPIIHNPFETQIPSRTLQKNMSETEHHKLIEKIVYGLKIAEREMLEKKARNNENVIVCGDDNVIRHIPAQNFL